MVIVNCVECGVETIRPRFCSWFCSNEYHKRDEKDKRSRAGSRSYGKHPVYRFLENVSMEGVYGSCWMWVGSRSKHGYGKFQPIFPVTIGAHRLSYELFKGPIPFGLHIDHTCSNPSCINPEHLEAVTVAENNRRTIARGRARWQRWT
jgi:hypothetical protein